MSKKINRLELVYNGNTTITESGFTMQSNFVLPVLSRMVDEGIINFSAQTVVQTILTYKHTKENPYPSREELARVLGKSVSYVRKALKSIKDAGILLIEKSGRKNTYNFNPFFNILEKFINEFVTNKNDDIKISELMISVPTPVSGGSKDFKGIKEEVKEDDIKEETTSSLPEDILLLLQSNNVKPSGIKLVESKYNSYNTKLDDKVFMQKITASASKNNFNAFFTTCIDNAFINNEKPKETPIPSYINKGNEVIPEWFVNRNNEENKLKSDDYAEHIKEYDLDKLKYELERLEEFSDLIPIDENESMKIQHKLITMRLEDFNVSLEDLQTTEYDIRKAW